VIPLKDNIPTRKPAYVTYALIVANVLVFIFFQHALFGPHGGFSSAGSPERFIHYSFIPYELSHPGKHCDITQGAFSQASIACEGQPGVMGHAPSQPSVFLTILTAMFMHGGVLHIAGNMLFLWIFGNNVEDAMGRLKFLGFYLVGGIVASLAQFAIQPNAATPTLGASGAIAAVLGGYALLYPRARVITLIFIIFLVTVIELPALVVLGGWFLFQLLDASSQPLGGGGVAYFAHIGGFLFGRVVINLLATQYDPYYERRGRLPVY
jgi:membrane associated rhomboid family serine protease